VELCREFLRRSGQRVPDDKLGLVARAIATTDLPGLLLETSRRYLLDGWQYAEATWPLWTDEGSTNDFKESTLLDFAIDNRLHEKKQGEEYKFNQLAESSEKFRVITYGAKFAITREAIINDDLDALTRIPRVMGEGAARVIGDGVYGALIANAVMGDGLPLFSTQHNNLAVGQGGVPTVDKLAAAELLMSRQTDAFGAKLNLQPTLYIAPVALRAASEQFFNTLLIGSETNAGQPNISNYYANRFTRIYEARLDDDSETSRYLLARKQIGVRVFYLNGQKTPIFETKESWDIDGIEYRVRMDAGIKAVSWRGLQKQTEA
jgi:hypothetical protein